MQYLDSLRYNSNVNAVMKANLPEPIDAHQLAEFLTPVSEFLRNYHAHRIYGLERIPTTGPALIVFNHSFASYDMFMFAAAVYSSIGRRVRPLGDRLIFRTPLLKTLAHRLGIVEGSIDDGIDLLTNRNELVAVAPGGMREALRPRGERYRVNWRGREGFARLAFETQVPIILAACPAADDLYTLYDNPLTRLFYKKLRVPLPLLRGFGPTLLPRPVKLTHEISMPIVPPVPDPDPARHPFQISQFKRYAQEEMDELMELAASHHELRYGH